MCGENLVYSNLVLRKKILQRNMSVYDNRGNELLIVPSNIINDALSHLCELYVYKAWQLVGYHGRKELYDLIENPIDFNSIFYYDDVQQNRTNQEEGIILPVDNINRVKNVLKLLKNTTEHKNEINYENTSIFYINRILMLLNIYEKKYFIPFVALETPIKNHEYYNLHYSVDKVINTSLVHREFIILGSQEFRFLLEIQQSASNHIKILSPEGILFQYAHITDIKDVKLKEKFQNLNEYLDDDMIYFYVSPEESNTIVEEQKKASEIPSKEEQNEVESDDQGPVINFGLGVSNGFPRRLSLIRILVLLIYGSIFIPFISIVIFKHDIVLSNILGITVLTLTIIIAIGIYSIDKPFLESYVAGQIVIIITLFIIECACLYLIY
jgi:hypothetical protein